jgi:hypothetical protein
MNLRKKIPIGDIPTNAMIAPRMMIPSWFLDLMTDP